MQDVVDYTDAHYRTLAKAGSRGILGHSMGGYGTIKLAMKHPDVFSACYSMSGAYLVFDEYLSDSAMVAAMIEAFYNDPISELDLLISTVVAWAPNPSIPDYYGEIPYTEDGTLKDSVFQVYMQHDPYSMIDDLSANLETLSLLQFDCGTSDWWIIQNRHFSEKLTSRGIDHTFLEYDGDHTNRLAERLEDFIFIAFSQHLEHEYIHCP